MLTRMLYAPFLAQIVVTRRCNLTCGYCNEYDELSPPVPTDELKERFRRLKELGTWAIEFSGGEPLLHPQIDELVAYAKQLGFYKVMMITNGFLINEERTRLLNDAGLDDLQISIDGVTPNDTTFKVLKTLRPKLRTVMKVARFRVTLNAVLGSAPVDEVREVIDFARAMGCRPSLQLVHGDDGSMSLSEEELRAFHDIQHELGRNLRSDDYRMRLMRDGRAPYKCRAGSRYLYVDEHGIVRWCSQQRTGFGIPLADYDGDDLKRQFHTRKECSESCTVGCVRNCSRVDRFRSQRLEPVADEVYGSCQEVEAPLVQLRR